MGDGVTIFDGEGKGYEGRIATCSRHVVEICTGAIVSHEPEPAARLTLAVAMPKGRRADILVEKCTELGVDAIIPLNARNSVVDARIRQPNRLAKWKRTAIEACKQCGRCRVPRIAPVADTEDTVRGGDWDVRLIASMAAGTVPLARVLSLADPSKPEEPIIRKNPGRAPLRVMGLVGPEGGFSEAEEAAAMVSGFVPVSLGSTRLRVETAAIALATALHLLGPLDSAGLPAQ